MVEAEKVSVRIVRHIDCIPYKEYNRPSTSDERGESLNERYIEVSTNERYYIEVKLLRGFKFLGQPKARVIYSLDNNDYVGILSRSKPSDSSSTGPSHRGDTCESVCRVINGQKMWCGLKFGQLESDEDVSLGDKEIAQAVDEAGRIVVKVCRGRFGGKVQDSSEPQAFDLPDHVDDTKTCKEVVHKHNVSHVTTHVPLGPSLEVPSRPGAYEREWIRAEGSKGKAIVFTIRYRSRAALVALGIKEDVDDERSRSEHNGSAAANLGSTFPDPLPEEGLFSTFLASRSGDTHESDGDSDDDDREDNNDSDATLITDGEERDSDDDSGNVNDPITITDGEEGDSDSDLHNDSNEAIEQQQEYPTQNEEEIRPIRTSQRSVEPRQETRSQNGKELHPSRGNERSIDQRRREAEAEARAEMRRCVREYMAREGELDQAKAITAVKRKIRDEQLENFPAAKRCLETLTE